MCTRPQERVRSTRDLPLELAEQRMTTLRADARHRTAVEPGMLARARNALGRRLIALGSALIEKPPRRRTVPG